MNRLKKYIMLVVMMLTMVNCCHLYAFDFENDPNFHKFTNGYKAYVKPIKAKDILKTKEVYDISDSTIYISAKVNGITLDELRDLAIAANAKVEVNKHSDGTSYMIITAKHDLTGHTLVMMIETKNRYEYVYDTDSYVSEVVDLGEYVQIYQGRTLVPLRKFIEAFGGVVKYKKAGHFTIDWPSLHK